MRTDSMPSDPPPWTTRRTAVLALLALAGLAAGFVDAVVGGGGLIQIPALLLGLPNAALSRCWPPTSWPRSAAPR